MIYYISESSTNNNSLKFKGINIEIEDDKYTDYCKRDLKVLNKNIQSIIAKAESDKDIKATKLISVRYLYFSRNDISTFVLVYNTNEKSHILTIEVSIKNNSIGKVYSTVDG